MNSISSDNETINIPDNYFEFSKQIYEYLSKYLKSYKTETSEYLKKLIKIQEKYISKLKGIEELKKIKNIDSDNITFLSTKIYNAIKVQVSELQLFLKGTDDIIKSFEKTIKDKSLISVSLNEYDDTYNSLQKKYKEVEKAKNIFFEHASKTEDLIYKFYNQPNINPNNKDFIIINSVTKSQIDNSIKNTKKYENEYSNLIKSAKYIEDKLIESIDNHNNNMIKNTCELLTNMKDNIINFLLMLENSFKVPLGEIDTYLPELLNLNEYKKIEEIINSSYKKTEAFKRMDVEKYNIKIIPDNNDKNLNDEDFIYIIEDKEILNTVKMMEENFDLIVKNSISEINLPEKLRCRLLIYKLLSFSKKVKKLIKDLENQEKGIEINDNINIEITEDYSITKEETDELFKLLEKGDNRMIFLRKFNNFRRFGTLEIPTREFHIICDIMNMIIKYVKGDKNLEAQISVVILSETYYKIENQEKIYILNYVKHNQIFHEKDFWFDFINKSILKEVQRNLKNDLIKNSDKDIENAKRKKFENLIFAQILPIIKTMTEFGLEETIICDILESLVMYYQLTETSKNMLLAMVNEKLINNEKGANNDIKDKENKAEMKENNQNKNNLKK
jgi:hypothetical protein